MLRWLKHLCSGDWQLRRAFPQQALSNIEVAIHESELTHQGEIRFAVESGLDLWPLLRNQTARERAIQVFSDLRVWDTEHNNGVLIYLLLADRDVEIVADRGIHAHVGAEGWKKICRDMEAAFRAGQGRPSVAGGRTPGATDVHGSTNVAGGRTPGATSGLFEQGVIRGIKAVGAHLDKHYPKRGADINELPNRPTVL